MAPSSCTAATTPKIIKAAPPKQKAAVQHQDPRRWTFPKDLDGPKDLEGPKDYEGERGVRAEFTMAADAYDS